jgi:hypothetical protein
MLATTVAGCWLLFVDDLLDRGCESINEAVSKSGL